MTEPDAQSSAILERIASMSPQARAALEAKLGQIKAEAGGDKSLEAVPRAGVPVGGDAQPASFAQERLWFFDRLHPGSPAYNVTRLLKFSGHPEDAKSGLRIDLLRRALQAMVDRHDILRTNFVLRDGQVFQTVKERAILEIAEKDLRADFAGLDSGQRDLLFDAALRSAVTRTFDLENDHLIRAHLYRQNEGWALLLVNHHIVSDGWSARKFIDELAELYAAFLTGTPLPPQRPGLNYAGYTNLQRSALGSNGKLTPRFSELLHFWKEYLGGHLPVLGLPADKVRPAKQSFLGEQIALRIPADAVSGLRALSATSGVTLYMAVLAAVNILLHRYSRQCDLLVGTPIAARDRVEVEQTLGYFANTLVIRNDLSGDPSCAELLARVHASCIAAYSHQEMPFERLVSELPHERSLSHPPVFQVAVAWQDGRKSRMGFAGLEVDMSEISTGTSKFDLTFDLGEDDDGSLAGWIEYSSDLFNEASIQRMSLHLENIIREMTRSPEKPISRLQLASDEEPGLVLGDWAGGVAGQDSGELIHQIFEARVAEDPGRVALIYEGAELTYGQLNDSANRLAEALVLGVPDEGAQGARPAGRPIGVLMERSPDMVAAFTAVLKSGGAYLPLDPQYPAERLAYMLADAGADQLITTSALRRSVPAAFGGSVVIFDDAMTAADDAMTAAGRSVLSPRISAPASTTSPEKTPAYVMYTSGSTGRPKGAVIPHSGVIRLVTRTGYVNFGSGETTMHMSAPAFDAATFEIWGALLNGGKCVILPPGAHSLSYIGDRLLSNRVTTIFLTVALFNAFIDQAPENLRCLRQLLSGGAANSVKHVISALSLLPDTRLFNGYGPTENTTFSLCFEVPRDFDPLSSSVPIGRPIAGTQAYILDDLLHPVPIGVEGELYLGGSGLAIEYVNAPELTAEKFIDVYLGQTAGRVRLYRTGDRARFLPGGNVEYLGRTDQQLKIRGFRVEPAEIENILREHEAIGEAVVVGRDNGAERNSALAAYCVPRKPSDPAQAAISPQGISSYLRSRLPAYMIPSTVVILESLPLTPNGKIDFHALPAHSFEPEGGEPASPRSPAEEKMAQIWRSVLGSPSVGINDNFFEVGGHSLLAVRLLSDIEKEVGRRIPLTAIFESPTIAGLCSRLEVQEQQGRAEATSLVLIRAAADSSEAPLFMVPGGSGGEAEFLVYAGLATHFTTGRAVYGFRARGHIKGELPHRTVAEMAADYIADMRRLQPEGPYHVGGECLGGIVAHEIARQLARQGQDVSAVVLLDTRFPAKTKLAVHVVRQLWQQNRFRKALGKMFRKYGWAAGYTDPAAADPASIGPSPGDADPWVRRTSLLYPRTLLAHRPQTYDGEAHYFVSDQMRGMPSIDKWRGLCSDGLQVHELPGSHYSYIREYAKVAGQMLSDVIDNSEMH